MWEYIYLIEAKQPTGDRKMKTVNTYRGDRKIDVAAKTVENNNGEMVSYIEVKPYPISGVMHFAYIYADGKGATMLTAQGHKDAHEISVEQKAINVRNQNIARLNSEGYEAY
jgi:hypothetical protein